MTLYLQTWIQHPTRTRIDKSSPSTQQLLAAARAKSPHSSVAQAICMKFDPGIYQVSQVRWTDLPFISHHDALSIDKLGYTWYTRIQLKYQLWQAQKHHDLSVPVNGNSDTSCSVSILIEFSSSSFFCSCALLLLASRIMRRAVISAGLTPPTLLAWPTVCGLTWKHHLLFH